MLRGNGFDADDIPQLVKLSKDTGKVHFALTTDPILYEGLDHLEPIFSELRPSFLASTPLDVLADAQTCKKWSAEFYTIADISYSEFLKTKPKVWDKEAS